MLVNVLIRNHFGAIVICFQVAVARFIAELYLNPLHSLGVTC